MNFKLILILLFFPVLIFSQKKRDKASVRESDFRLNSTELRKIDNPTSPSATISVSEAGAKAKRKHNSIVIINPNENPIKFSIGTTDVMEVVEIKPKSFWNSEVVGDLRFTFVMKTGQKIVHYDVMNNKCYSIFWNKKSGMWDLADEFCTKTQK